MNFKFPTSHLKINQEDWCQLFHNNPTPSYHPKTLEFSQEPHKPKGYKYLSIDQIADITEFFKGSEQTTPHYFIGYDIAIIALGEQAKHTGITGLIHRIFSRVFNFIVRGTFSTGDERCKKLAQELIGLTPYLNDQKAREEYLIDCACKFSICDVEAVADNEDEKTFKFFTHTLLRWLVEDKSTLEVANEVLYLTPKASS